MKVYLIKLLLNEGRVYCRYIECMQEDVLGQIVTCDNPLLKEKYINELFQEHKQNEKEVTEARVHTNGGGEWRWRENKLHLLLHLLAFNIQSVHFISMICLQLQPHQSQPTHFCPGPNVCVAKKINLYDSLLSFPRLSTTTEHWYLPHPVEQKRVSGMKLLSVWQHYPVGSGVELCERRRAPSWEVFLSP